MSLEIELLVPPSGVSSGLISKPEIKELNRMNESFRSLGVRPQVVDALAARGIDTPFPIQRLVLPEALAGVDVLAKSPTGSGKTLAFGLALVERTKPGSGKPTALVLVPTRELAAQVAEELRAPAGAAGLKIEAIYGGVPLGRQAKRARSAEILV